MKKACLCFSLLLVFICGCKKENYVMLRIENATNANFSKILTNAKEYDNLTPGSTSVYKSYDKIVEVPGAVMIQGNDTMSCGLFFYDYPTYINSGRYTLKIFSDTSAYFGYNCIYIKE